MGLFWLKMQPIDTMKPAPKPEVPVNKLQFVIPYNSKCINET